jgi:hypothetical protein
MSRRRDRDELHIPKYLPKPVSCVAYILRGVGVLFFVLGFFWGAGTILFQTAISRDEILPYPFDRLAAIEPGKLGALFFGLVLLAFFLFMLTNVFIAVTSRIFKPKQEPPDGDDDTHQARRLYFSQIQQVTDKTLKENLIAAVKSLNIESVDMGLFYLGKIFERELREFLTDAQAQNTFPVTSKDLARLASMIDCIERNGIDIVREKHHLTFLRQERNARAHGQIPSFEERKRMMEQAPFIGGLFIDCIIAIHKKRVELAAA